jgi:ABC-type uncharacterized transport system involved in gliding motility auxiliary subunit
MLNKILGLLGWLGIALVAAGVAVRFLLPHLFELRTGLLASGLVCLLLYMLGQWREIARLFGKRQARYGTLATGSILLVLGILIAINYVLSRQNKRWDLTAAGQYSLSDQTKRILERLEAPINVLVFAREGEFPRYRDRLQEYEYTSDQVSVEYIDVDRQPVVARQYEVQSYGTVVFDYEGRIERVVSDTEQDLTTALIKAVEGEERTIYFLQGHGEKDIVSSERDGYSAVADSLALDNFGVESLVLVQEGEVPEDASMVVVAGPTIDLLPAEVDALRTYLRAGGKALFLLDPPPTPDAPELPNVSELLGEWAIDIGNNVVVDVSGVGQLIGTDASVPVAASYPPHAITDRFNLLTAYPLARSVDPVPGGVEGRFADPFVETSPRSWAEADISELVSGEVEMNESEGDVAGPINIAAAVSAPVAKPPEPPPDEDSTNGGNQTASVDEEAPDQADEEGEPTLETRVAVVGDSDFAANFSLGIQGNRDLFLNTINWLAQQENLIAIRPREPDDRRVTLTADQQRRVFLIAFLMVPSAVFALGFYTWWRRR